MGRRYVRAEFGTEISCGKQSRGVFEASAFGNASVYAYHDGTRVAPVRSLYVIRANVGNVPVINGKYENVFPVGVEFYLFRSCFR